MKIGDLVLTIRFEKKSMGVITEVFSGSRSTHYAVLLLNGDHQWFHYRELKKVTNEDR
tara:strand:+ start:1303 stop:1476 length:174 start_codon:yes stop_codon:yes gene_type:complete